VEARARRKGGVGEFRRARAKTEAAPAALLVRAGHQRKVLFSF